MRVEAMAHERDVGGATSLVESQSEHAVEREQDAKHEQWSRGEKANDLHSVEVSLVSGTPSTSPWASVRECHQSVHLGSATPVYFRARGE
jgi:hypothetical protein